MKNGVIKHLNINLILLFFSVFIFSSCNQNTKEEQNLSNDSVLVISDSLLAVDLQEDTINLPEEISKPIPKTEEIFYSRCIQFPGDNNFNGKPLIHQLDIKLEDLENNPDTLNNLAKNWYWNFKDSYPISISDNFEDGISKEIIDYPKKLIFEFQLFEDEYSAKPYEIIFVTLRNENGELQIE
ncbi:MAG: hypothetical protein JXL97_10635 [Bacteroidales bacterium]|nr:hypothetical protein [Bacteroidales bacterium]